MQSAHSLTCVGASTAAAFPTPSQQCCARFARRGTKRACPVAACSQSFRGRLRPVHVAATAGSVETAQQPSADAADLGRVPNFVDLVYRHQSLVCFHYQLQAANLSI